MADLVYTIGHSTHSIERFIDLLKRHQIDAVCDVRSRPYSRMNPQFNRETLKKSLADVGIRYVFLGEELGARTTIKDCYVDGRVDYALLAQTELFRSGLQRIRQGALTYRIALMCAEKEPLDCHRTILVARHLVESGMPVVHILADGSLEDHLHAIERLVGRLKIPDVDMFREKEAVIKDAYARQAREIAYREDGPNHAQDVSRGGALGAAE